MKSIVVKSCLVAVFVALLVADADAQRAGRRRTNPPANTTNPQDNQQQNNNNTQPSGYNPYGKIPSVVD